MILIRFFFCHESSIDTHIDTNQLILLSQVRTQKTKKSVADGHLTSSKEVEKMGHVMDICETDSVKKNCMLIKMYFDLYRKGKCFAGRKRVERFRSEVIKVGTNLVY